MTTDGTVIFTDARPPEQGGYPGFRPAGTVVDGIRVERDVAVPLRDGTRVYVDVCRPDRATGIPALIAYAPYGKHNGFPPILAAGAGIDPPLPDGARFEAPLADYWCRHGYAVVHADPRGTWGSEGDATMYSRQEAEDGHDLVEWAGTREWSNGRVGLTGVSYLAVTQYGIAATRPPHLAAINPNEGKSDHYREAAFHGGIPETQFTARLTTLIGFGRNRTEDRLAEIRAHPFRDSFWAAQDVEFERIEVPALFVCSVGNHGLHTRGTLEAYRRTGSEQKWLDVHGRKEWRYFYSTAQTERIRAFFDRFLKGEDTEVTSWPPVRVEYRDRTETGPVRDESSWPPARTRPTAFHLDATTGRLTSAVPDGPGRAAYDPTRSQPPAGRSQRQAGAEKAVFTLAFGTDAELAGPAALRLWAESPGADDLDVFVELDKLDADGRAAPYPYFAYLDDGPLAQGWLRATRRELDDERSTPERPVQAHRRDLPLPDGPVALDIEIWPFTARFHAGETLRLTVAGADLRRWPPEEFAPGHDRLVNTAPHILHTGPEHDSRLLLPLTHPTTPTHPTPQ
ncbi:CocE/NonD family hydrolase [Streptomyces sp. AV19]|uniref:CocE/NonD family hydrolase n=1 Tax=Streptomyces sp. AV19 TaxID=2793068 RepID=UPI0018FEDD9F|nr:CocE/NonD family hydrolase [Streptomyces sp. AV19]MBH1937677.1 CocE/NonD family hydrolase [Streptomyces sp. AV19]MDG4536344.1 CocE/NonD family hydrolase [Streptomyces sp. AV19]